MKIGVLTVPFNNNYGGFLQAFALKTTLEKKGHNVIFINRKRNKSQRPLWKKFLGFPLIKFREIQRKRIEKKLSIYTDPFKQKYLSPITTEFFTHDSLKKCLTLGVDVFVVGSDQVWRYKYARESIDDFFFSFLQDKTLPRFSYAASFGTEENEYPEEYKDRCMQLLNDFVSISVREKSGKDLLVKEFQVSPERVKTVLDPTLLLDREDYERLFELNQDSKEPYLCTYILDQSCSKTNLISEASLTLKSKVIGLNAQTGDVKKLEPIKSVESWLQTIAKSSFVVTDSFHGAVFSIIFNRPFLVIGNETRGKARFQSLLSLFDLQSRYIDDVCEFDRKLLSENIDWNSVNLKKNFYKQESLKFIADSLESCRRISLCQ